MARRQAPKTRFARRSQAVAADRLYARARSRGRHRRASRTSIQILRVSRPKSQETRSSPQARPPEALARTLLTSKRAELAVRGGLPMFDRRGHHATATARGVIQQRVVARAVRR